MPKSCLYGLVLATFLAPAAFGQPAQPPRNMQGVTCRLAQSSLDLAAGSWAATLDIAQSQEVMLRAELVNAVKSATYANQWLADLTGKVTDQEAEIARLKAEIAELKKAQAPPPSDGFERPAEGPPGN